MQQIDEVGTNHATNQDRKDLTQKALSSKTTGLTWYSSRSRQRGAYLTTLLLRLGLGLAGLTVMLFAQAAFSMSGHPDEIICNEEKSVSSQWDRVQCEFHRLPYIPLSARQNYPASIIIPKTPLDDHSLRMVADLHG